MNIVIVEDHHALRRVTSRMLREEGHSVIELFCAEDLKENVGIQRVDLFIIDLNLPGEDGISLAKRLRLTYPQVGIIMVTARASAGDVANGYANGADIYLAKPVLPDVLIAAVNSLGRRLKSGGATPTLLLNADVMTLSGHNGVATILTREAELLIGFAQSVDQQLETGEVAELLGMDGVDFSKSTLEIRIVRLRKKLKQADIDAEIKSIRLFGYRLTPKLVIA